MAHSLSVRLDGRTARALSELARATDRPKTYFVEKAVESYLAEGGHRSDVDRKRRP
jgi:predicted transcriptional regulator